MRLAIDPGKTTGVAWRSGEELRALEWPGDDIAVVLIGFHGRYGITEVVVENFRSRPGPAVNLSPPEIIGRIQAWADEYGIPVVRQDAAPVKVRVTPDRLRAHGGWFRGKDHARDAARHLLYREERLGLVALA